MKRAIISLFATFLIVAIAAADNHSVVIVKQLTHTERNKLPDNTIEYKVPVLEFNYKKGDTALIATVTQLLDTISDLDFNNSYYSLSLTPTGNGSTRVIINSLQELPQDARNDAFTGMYGRFLVLRDKSSEPLLKQVFTKGKGKVTLVQEFEIVDEIIQREPALLEATFSGAETIITTFLVNGDNHCSLMPSSN